MSMPRHVQRETENPIDFSKGKREAYARLLPMDWAVGMWGNPQVETYLLSRQGLESGLHFGPTCCHFSLAMSLKTFFILFFYFFLSFKAHLVCGTVCFKHKQVFLLHLVIKASFILSPKLFSPLSSYSHRREPGGELSAIPHHVLFVVPVTSQMSPAKTARIPTWPSPSDCSNGGGSSRAGGREAERRAASLPP